MGALMEGRLLLYGGGALAVLALVGGAAAGVILHLSGKRLRARLDEEFGERQR